MNLVFKYPHVIVFLVAYSLADLAVAGLIRVAGRIGALDAPGAQDYKVQERPVPFLGGLGLFVGFVLALALTLDWARLGSKGVSEFLASVDTRTSLAVIFGGMSCAVIGLIDDFRPIGAVIKLGLLFVLTGFLAWVGLAANVTPYAWLNFVITLVWIVGVTSAFNAIDNTDGVAGTTAMSVAFWTFAIAWGASARDAQPGLSMLALAIVGSTLGFFRYNRPKARVYLGNSGSFALGFLVAVMALSGRWTASSLNSSMLPLLLVSYPLFDLGYTVFMRWKRGIVRGPIEAVIVSGRDHTAHRLRALGLSPWSTLVVIGFLNGLAGFVCWLIMRFQLDGWAFWGGVALVALVYLAFGLLIRNAVDLRSKEARISNRRPTSKILTPTQPTEEGRDRAAP